jgi:hypothetical protein
MIKGIIDTINNDSMTAGEKVLAILGSVAAIIPMLTMGFTSLTTAIWGAEAATIKEGIAHTKAAVAKGLHFLAMKIFPGAMAKVTAAENAETGAVNTNTVAWYANPVMWIAAIIIGIVAAIAVLIAIFAHLNDVMSETPEEKLASAKEEAAAMATALEETKNRAEELK